MCAKFLRMSYWYRLQAYYEASAKHRVLMHEDEQDHLLICTRMYVQMSNETKRKNHITGNMDEHVPSCGGKCNKS